MTEQAGRTAQFRTLHETGSILVLPNAWDAASARLAEACGAKAVATSSAAVSWAHGYPDGEALPSETHLAMTAEIVRAVRIPVSIDSEAGFSPDPNVVANLVAALGRAGASGVNLEDGTSPPELLAAKIKAVKEACKHAGVDVFVNARADVYLRRLTPPEKALDETIRRGKLYQDAGADGLFVPGLADLAGMKAIAEAISLPLNVLTKPDQRPVAELKTAGVRRLSSGGGIARAALGAARRATIELLEKGTFGALYGEAEGVPDMNALMRRE